MASNIPALENFDCEGDICSVALKWQKWKRALFIYLDASSIESSRKKRVLLLHFGGLGLQEIFYNLPGANIEEGEDIDVFDVAITKLDQYFATKQKKVYERHVFRGLKQEKGEQFEEFLGRLRNQAAKCGFFNADEQIIDQITEKCLSSELRKNILTTGDSINLTTIVVEANTLESVGSQISEFNEKPSISSFNDVNNVLNRGNKR